MTLTFDQQLQVQAWKTTMQKQIITRSVFGQFSNRVEVNTQIPNVNEDQPLPKTAILDLTDQYKTGVNSVRVPMINQLKQKMQLGRERVKGNEGTPATKFFNLYWNVQRAGVTVREGSVDGDTADFYKYGQMSTDLLGDLLVKQTDFDAHRSLIEGAPEHLTLTTAWDGPSVTSPPMSRFMHPNFWARGKSAVATYSATAATYEGNIQSYLDSLTTSSNPFSLAAMQNICLLASRTLIPLGMKVGKGIANWICFISEIQAQELQSISGTWASLMQEADVMGDDNRAISGKVGLFQGVLFVVNPRSPIWNTGGSANAYVAYAKPDTADGAFSNGADAAVTRAAKTTTGAGTCELAIVLGARGLARVNVRDPKFNKDSEDYDFFEGQAVERAYGIGRPDFDIGTPTASSKRNDTSLIYATATPSIAY